MLRRILLSFILLVMPFAISACDDEYPTFQEIIVAGNSFLMPKETDVHWWSFYDAESWLRFSLNVETFDPHNSDILEQKKKTLSVKIGPLLTMDRGYYWTEKDKILQLPEISCDNIEYKNNAFELCDHGFTNEQIKSARAYTIKRINNGEYITVLECNESSPLPNPLCVARMRFLDNLQINYHYNTSYFDKSVEINQSLRELIRQFHRKP